MSPHNTEPKLKISSTGWLCAWSNNEWLAVVKLTDEQLSQWQLYLSAMT